MTENSNQQHSFECRTPASIAKEMCHSVMPAKANSSFKKILVLGIMAGAFIGFGAEISTFVSHDAAHFVGYGLSKLFGAMVFSVGLMMVILTGAELFTSNCLISLSVLQKKATIKSLIRNWSVVYLSNFIGAVILAMLIYYSGLWKSHDFLTGAAAVKITFAKLNLTWVEAFTRGIMCNWIVCLAVWMAYASKQVIGKIFAIFFPITIFVASGFEHSVANMFYVPKGIMLSSVNEVATATHLSLEQLSTLTWSNFITHNLIPVTIGNIVGAALFVAFLFWVVFIRKSED